ncbi:hypothetical protein M1466_01940 [Candidatus Dependentiae bacterium]|nr:hypothetical protein [Candidatus Dependentiae bacterium]
MNNPFNIDSSLRSKRLLAMALMVLMGITCCICGGIALYYWYYDAIVSVQLCTYRQQRQQLTVLTASTESLQAEYRAMQRQQDILEHITAKRSFLPDRILQAIAQTIEDDIVLMQATMQRRRIELVGCSAAMESLQQFSVHLQQLLLHHTVQLNAVQFNEEKKQYQFTMVIGERHGN